MLESNPEEIFCRIIMVVALVWVVLLFKLLLLNVVLNRNHQSRVQELETWSLVKDILNIEHLLGIVFSWFVDLLLEL